MITKDILCVCFLFPPSFALSSLDIEAFMLFAFVIYFNNLYAVLQPVFSPSVLAEMMRPDGLSTISVLGGESLSAELAHELMGIQVIRRL